jgi:aromatic aminotransferase
MANNPQVNQYGPDEGLTALRDALKAKVAKENGLQGIDVMVTAGANQAFINIVLTLLDAGDQCVLFLPFYFNHAMALSMTGVHLLKGQCDSQTWHPDLDWLQHTLSSSSTPPKMIVMCNPCNPTGVALSKQEVQRASDMCKKAGVWLILDNTYEYFVYPPHQHWCIAAPHIINIFSFSKAYGMMGWRMGYLAYTDQEFICTNGNGNGSSSGNSSSGGSAPPPPATMTTTTTLGGELLKVQDTIPICPPQLSQYVAIGALKAGREWVKEKVHGLEGNRQVLLDALSPLGRENIAGGEGAIYVWAKLPERGGNDDDVKVVEWLVKKHKVCVIPGSSCGVRGYIRAAFANLEPELCGEAAARLKVGLTELVEHGMA